MVLMSSFGIGSFALSALCALFYSLFVDACLHVSLGFMAALTCHHHCRIRHQFIHSCWNFESRRLLTSLIVAYFCRSSSYLISTTTLITFKWNKLFKWNSYYWEFMSSLFVEQEKESENGVGAQVKMLFCIENWIEILSLLLLFTSSLSLGTFYSLILSIAEHRYRRMEDQKNWNEFMRMNTHISVVHVLRITTQWAPVIFISAKWENRNNLEFMSSRRKIDCEREKKISIDGTRQTPLQQWIEQCIFFFHRQLSMWTNSKTTTDEK